MVHKSFNNVWHLVTKTITTLQHSATLHPTTLHYIYWHFTSSHLHFTTLSFSFTHLHFLSFYFTSHHITRHSTDLIPKIISKKSKPLHCPKELLTISLYLTFYFIQYPLFLSDFSATWIFLSYFRKVLEYVKFMRIHPVGAVLFHADRRTDGQKWRNW
jgi:hypothetical protein